MGLPSPGSPGVEARSIAINPASSTDLKAIGQASPAGDGCASSANPRATTLSLQAIISKKKTSSIWLEKRPPTPLSSSRLKRESALAPLSPP